MNPIGRGLRLSTLAGAVLVGLAAAEPPQPELLLFEEPVVTSVAKKPQTLAESPAAVFVITKKDIRRSGAETIPDVLRMVPGVDVAQISAHQWAVSARGFNQEFANKLLVLVDGRSVYEPLFSGTLWNEQDLLLEDVERIEVIRGPGGTLWGANAVNGVINVITEDAKDTQGALVTAGGGSELETRSGVRYGGEFAAGAAHYRVWGKYSQWDDLERPAGRGADDWRMARGGFRLDWTASAQDVLTLDGDLYRGEIGRVIVVPSVEPPFREPPGGTDRIGGGHLLGRWLRSWSDGAETLLQLYYDREERTDFTDLSVDTGDVALQHNFRWGERHDVVAGAGYRAIHDRIEPSSLVVALPETYTNHVFNVFVQDDLTLVANRLHLIVGTKVEHNEFSGFELEPNARLWWRPAPRFDVWAAVSRAVQTPDRSTSDIRTNVAAFPDASGRVNLVGFFANPSIEPEQLIAYELGLRVRPTDALFLDVAGFYNDYRDLRSYAARTPFVENDPSPPHVVIPFTITNERNAQSYGVEFAGTWAPTRWSSLSVAYTWFDNAFQTDAAAGSGVFESHESSPHNQANARLHLDLPLGLDTDAAVYYVDEIVAAGQTGLVRIPSYTRLDFRLGWRPSAAWEASLALQNALDPSHPEFPGVLGYGSEIQRGAFGKLTWRW